MRVGGGLVIHPHGHIIVQEEQSDKGEEERRAGQVKSD